MTVNKLHCGVQPVKHAALAQNEIGELGCSGIKIGAKGLHASRVKRVRLLQEMHSHVAHHITAYIIT